MVWTEAEQEAVRDALGALETAAWSRRWSDLKAARARLQALTGLTVRGPLRGALEQARHLADRSEVDALRAQASEPHRVGTVLANDVNDPAGRLHGLTDGEGVSMHDQTPVFGVESALGILVDILGASKAALRTVPVGQSTTLTLGIRAHDAAALQWIADEIGTKWVRASC